MSNTENKATPADLATMLGAGGNFEAQGKQYTILPTKIREILELKKDNLSISERQQGFNLLIDENAAKLDKWLKRKVQDSKGEPMSIEKITSEEHDWDSDDLSECLRKLYKISG